MPSAVFISSSGQSFVTEFEDTMHTMVRAAPKAVLIFFVKLCPQAMCSSSRKAFRP